MAGRMLAGKQFLSFQVVDGGVAIKKLLAVSIFVESFCLQKWFLGNRLVVRLNIACYSRKLKLGVRNRSQRIRLVLRLNSTVYVGEGNLGIHNFIPLAAFWVSHPPRFGSQVQHGTRLIKSVSKYLDRRQLQLFGLILWLDRGKVGGPNFVGIVIILNT